MIIDNTPLITPAKLAVYTIIYYYYESSFYIIPRIAIITVFSVGTLAEVLKLWVQLRDPIYSYVLLPKIPSVFP